MRLKNNFFSNFHSLHTIDLENNNLKFIDINAFSLNVKLKHIVSKQSELCCNFKHYLSIDCSNMNTDALLFFQTSLFIYIFPIVLCVLAILIAHTVLVTRRTKDALNILQLLLSDFLKIITFGSLIYLHYFYRKQDQCIIHNYWIHSLNCKLLSEMFQMGFFISNSLYCTYFGNHYFLGTSMVRRSDKSIKILYAFVWLFVLSLSSKIMISAEATTRE